MGAVYAIFAAWYFWGPKVLGKPYNEVLAQVHFWSFTIGVNLTFIPFHFLGLAGQPRRISDYPDAYAGWNEVASYGSMISLIATLLFLYILYDQLTSTVSIAPNYWAVPQFFEPNTPVSPTLAAPTLEGTKKSINLCLSVLQIPLNFKSLEPAFPPPVRKTPRKSPSMKEPKGPPPPYKIPLSPPSQLSKSCPHTT
ncbi:17193_t:CDS:2 [Funneliformis geosporum]|nr:17193_t:CDS:2 [Funneliformis geosporum]